MKRLKLLVSVTLLMVAMPVLGYDFCVDGIFYNITSSEGLTCEVTFEKEYVASYSKDVAIPAEVVYGGKTYVVNSIGVDAFWGCSELNSVTIPSSVAQIKERAFYLCSNIKSFVIPASVNSIEENAFGYCASLSTVELPNTLATISDRMFVSCPSLASISIPASVETIGEAAFLGCLSLGTIDIPESVASIGDWAFKGCAGLSSVVIPSNVTKVGIYAFSGCSNLKSVIIEDCRATLSLGRYCFDGSNVEDLYIGRSVYANHDSFGESLKNLTFGGHLIKIREGAFQDITSLTSVCMKDESVIEIGESAFSGCTGLKSVQFCSCFEIGENAFSGCTGLTTVNIRALTIGRHAFYGCSNLESVTLEDDEVDEVCAEAFYGCTKLSSLYIGDGVSILKGFNDCTSLTEVVIPNSVTTIGANAFRKCTNLKSVTIGESVKTIEDFAFGCCSSLESIKIPDSVEEIKTFAFEECVALSAITLGKSLKSIDSEAFLLCKGVSTICIPSSVKNIGQSAFADCNNVKELVLEDSENMLNIDMNAFSGCKIEELYLGRNYKGKPFGEQRNSQGLCPTVKKVVMGGNITSIPKDAFAKSQNLASVLIGNTVTNIGAGAFSGCPSIESMTFVDGDKDLKLDEKAFSSCAMEKLYIGRNLNGENTFDTEIKEVVVSPCVSYIGEKVFNACPAIGKLTVEDGEQRLITKYEAFGQCQIEDLYIGRSFTYDDRNAFGTGVKRVSFGGNATIVPVAAFEDCKNLTSVDFGNTIKKIGVDAFRRCTALTDVSIPNSVDFLSGFYGCVNLKAISIPASVVEIGQDAFYNCSNIQNINIPDSVENIGSSAFYGCIGLTTVDLGNSVSKIGDYAFKGCSNLSSFTFPASVVSVGVCAFEGCASLKSVYIEEGTEKIVFYKDVFKDSEVESLYINRIFSGCPYGKGLKRVEFGNSLTSIDSFKGCTELSSVIIGDSATRIGFFAFKDCISLTDVKMGNSITTIEQNAFEGCSSLSGIDISSVKNIGVAAFRGCTSLASIELSNSITAIRESVFEGCTSLNAVSFGNSVRYIENNAFKDCASIESVMLPNSLGSVSSRAFVGCSSLKRIDVESDSAMCTSIDGVLFNKDTTRLCIYPEGKDSEEFTVPEGVTIVSDRAFYNNKYINSITLPSSLSALYDEALAGCSNLKEIISYNTNPPTVSSDTFDDVSRVDCVIRVPEDAVSQYKKASGWKEFMNIESIIPSGIENIGAFNSMNTRTHNVYSVGGSLVLRNASADKIRALPTGVYIVDGKKIFVK